MEKIYFENLGKCKLEKVKPQTIKFLLDYSKALKITKANGLQFESNMN